MFHKRIAKMPAAIAMLASVVIMLSLFSVAQAERVSALNTSISAAYERAFYETASLMRSMEINLEKVQVTGDSARRQTLLNLISREAVAAQSNLSVLPDSLRAVSESLKFVNQTGDYAVSLQTRLSEGEPVTEDDLAILSALHASCVSLNNLMADIVSQIERGDNPLSAAAEGTPTLSVADVELAQTDIEYPTLLYDGPFSDGRGDAEFKALGTNEVDANQALELARSFIGEERVHGLWITGEGSVPVPCYEISAYVDEGLISMAVTKQGGAVVYMMIDGVAAEAFYSQASLIDLAAAFLKSRGYPDVQVSYWVNYDNYLTVNFAVTEDGIVLYPDLIKVELSMESGLVVGFEAVNFLTNHTRRVLPDPALSEEEARALLNPVLSVTRSRLCVIPLDSGEALAYEFSVMMGETRYLVYLDALTGDELTIYRVVEDENGQLAI